MRETSGSWFWYPWFHSAWLDAHCHIATGSIVSSIRIINQLPSAPFNSFEFHYHIGKTQQHLLEMFLENDFTLKSEDSNLSKIWLCIDLRLPLDPSIWLKYVIIPLTHPCSSGWGCHRRALPGGWWYAARILWGHGQKLVSVAPSQRIRCPNQEIAGKYSYNK